MFSSRPLVHDQVVKNKPHRLLSLGLTDLFTNFVQKTPETTRCSMSQLGTAHSNTLLVIPLRQHMSKCSTISETCARWSCVQSYSNSQTRRRKTSNKMSIGPSCAHQLLTTRWWTTSPRACHWRNLERSITSLSASKSGAPRPEARGPYLRNGTFSHECISKP